MANYKNRAPFKGYESVSGCEKRFIRMADSQMNDSAFLNLNHAAFHVYIYMKLAKTEQKKNEFEFTYKVFKTIISKDGFSKAINELVEKGFVEVVERNANLRTANKYRFSSGWRFRNNWGSAAYDMHNN